MGSIETEIIEFVIARLLREQDNSLYLNSLGSYMTKLSKKNRKYIQKIGGFEKFIHRNPNKFAIIDERVHLLSTEGISIRATQSEPEVTVPKPVIKSNQPDAPADSAIISIIKELKNNPTCMVCSDDITIFAYGLCFHPICFKCCTKLRVLCLDKHCPACRAELPKVVYTTSLRQFSSIDLSCLNKEQKYGIYFETRKMYASHKKLLEHPCPNCNSTFDEFDRLEKHLKEKHAEYFCKICVKQCKTFTHERISYSREELALHEQQGDAGDGSAHKGHPLCQFCNQRYLDRDELYRHLNMNHITCKLCDNADNIFYIDLEGLWDHFEEEHFPCDAPDCRLNMNSAFRDELDLQAHKVSAHPNMRNKSERKQEKRVHLQVSYGRQQSRGFEFTSPQKETTIVRHPDGSIECDGTVLGQHLNSYFGFIQPDGDDLAFNDNIFFNQQSCNLDPTELLPNFFTHGDRVRVRATRAEHQRSKWRAVTVEKITSETLALGPGPGPAASGIGRVYTTSESSDMSSASLQADEFPALHSPRSSSQLSSNASWNNLNVHKKQKIPYKPAASPGPSGTTKKVTESSQKKNGACPEYGTGVVHHNLHKEFGFIVWKGAKDFTDNIYFHRMCYLEGMNLRHCGELTQELPIGTKVEYKLDYKSPNNGIKSKYRAQWVKKFGVSPSTSSNEETSKSAAKVEHAAPPAEGIGTVHAKLQSNFGFIVWDGCQGQEDNIYFNKFTYEKGSGLIDNDSWNLTTELKPGAKVRYVIDVTQGFMGTSKYRASKVWKYEENAVPPSTSQQQRRHSKTDSLSSASTSSRGEPPSIKQDKSPKKQTNGVTKPIVTTKITVKELLEQTKAQEVTPSASPTPDPQRDLILDLEQNGTDGLCNGTSDGGDFVYNSSDEDFQHFGSSIDENVEGLSDSFHESDISYSPVPVEDDAERAFHEILKDISGKDYNQVLKPLVIGCSQDSSNCIFVQFSRRDPTKIFLSTPKGATPNSTESKAGAIHHVECKCSGFDDNVVGGLIIRGVLSCDTPNVMNVVGSSHYVLLHRNDKGAVESLTLHFRR
uniref:RING-type E3 ubiquitin transferase n=1 Tax=Phallusia mammillata TaxID=59560 RepID=A0A6F9DJA2_9ASCI|nr:uncharacterized protein LOC104266457 [Phallusia mammillata]